MYLSAERVIRALDCSDKVLEGLGIVDTSGRFIPVSIEEIQDYVAKTTGSTITKDQVIYPQPQYIRGRLHRFTGKVAKIHARFEQGPDWKRLVAAKELFEILVGDTSDMCPYGDEILETLVFEGHIGIICPQPLEGSAKGQSELISELAAMETLYPPIHRNDDIPKLHPNGPLTIAKLALRYGLPESVVATMVNPRYGQVLREARNHR